FFILINKKKSFVAFIDPAEASDLINFIKQGKSTDSLLLTSSGDFLFSKSSHTNIFQTYDQIQQDRFFVIDESLKDLRIPFLVKKILNAALHMGIIEIFASKYLYNYIKKEDVASQIDINLIYTDPELTKTDLLTAVSLEK